ncbi:putative methyltransferase [Actinoplanes missouriensis 431]|uniref:Putative methyltransferase n=1 Tax=Actinoplanes missouriensis (strain ATCC 14538 / DSM 43046 / CBS 188.64 / JCM 3121 / NBRC 102363 / NCIMB 12654 / NRRL B-3342 / UNCC 431) TaxID=512565 RepID=I0HEE4_ACTM4|nr:class I SAM-dependent methyltransferase [Actinoplanes missouriensis]BAL91381.1 putative methyltransferase [Actinoplanes missouriensis 431]
MTTTNSIKDKHRAMWASGDYPALAAEVVAPLGPVLVEAAGIGPGQTVLDVGAGTGNAAIPAALKGATVTASDLTPELLAAGERLAASRGTKLTWTEADAEALPFETASFDTVISCIGVMFAPFHTEAAGELLRVCRPGGTVALANWTPEGFIGQLFATMKPYAAPPPAGAQPPPRWGDPAHLAELFGDGVTDVRVERRTLRVDRFATGAEMRDYFKSVYGPTIAVYRNIAGDPSKVAALDAAIAELAEGAREWEYLLYVAKRSA